MSNNSFSNKLIEMSLQAAAKRQPRLDEDRFYAAIGRAPMSRDKVLEYTEQFGLGNSSFSGRKIILPLAKVISCLKPESRETVRLYLEEFTKDGKITIPTISQIQDLIKKGFVGIADRTVEIVNFREGLKTGEIETLQAIGDRYGLTRERVRQLEETFWDKVQTPGSSQYPNFLKALLSLVIYRHGSLALSNKDKFFQMHRFLCKANDVPFETFDDFGFSIMALSEKDIKSIKNEQLRIAMTEAKKLAKEFDGGEKVSLIKPDIEFITGEMVSYYRKHFIRAERIYITFLQAGRPLHFSELLVKHNAIFPDRRSTERSIRSAMNAHRYVDKYGFVWVGSRGTYGLREWGYEKPSENLMTMAFRITKEAYEKSGAPVHLDYIKEEILRVRKLVKISSIIIAASCNARLIRLSDKMFLPNTVSQKVLKDLLKKHNLHLPARQIGDPKPVDGKKK